VLIYATSSDYSTWSGVDTSPANVDQLLRSASLLIAEATSTARYVVDDTGLPTDTILVGALRDATCAQVVAWVAAGVDPTAAGLQTASIVRGKGIGSARLEYDTSLSASVTAFQARQQIASELCDEAIRILQPHRLLTTRPWTWG